MRRENLELLQAPQWSLRVDPPRAKQRRREAKAVDIIRALDLAAPEACPAPGLSRFVAQSMALWLKPVS